MHGESRNTVLPAFSWSEVEVWRESGSEDVTFDRSVGRLLESPRRVGCISLLTNGSMLYGKQKVCAAYNSIVV